MKNPRTIIALLLVILFTNTEFSYGQPNISNKEIPQNIPIEIRVEIEKLYSLDPVERGNAANSLGKMGKNAVSAVPYLIAMIGDRTPLQWVAKPGTIALRIGPTSPSKLAVEALGRIKDPLAVDPLIALLKNANEDPSIRMEAAEALGRIKDPRAVDPLILSLKDNDNSVREWAAKALGEIKDPRALEPMIFALKDKNYYFQQTAKKALEAMDPNWRNGEAAKQTVPEFINALKYDSDSTVRRGVVWTLDEIKDPRAVESLLAVLKDKDTYVRETAAKALQGIDPNWRNTKAAKQAVSEFIAALKDKDSIVREGAAWALGAVKDPLTVELLVVLLKDENYPVRRTTILALGEMNDRRAVEPLINALRDEDSSIRDLAGIALRKITKENYGENIDKWQEWWERNKAN